MHMESMTALLLLLNSVYGDDKQLHFTFLSLFLLCMAFAMWMLQHELLIVHM